MKILLINPPQLSDVSWGSLEQFKNIDIGTYPPLGLMYVAGYLMRFSDFEIEIMDCACDRLSYEETAAKVNKKAPHIIGVYVSAFTLYDAYQIVRFIRRENKESRIVFGGPHVEIFPHETLGLAEVDFAVMGEGEASFLELLEALRSGGSLGRIKGIGYRENGQVFINEMRPMIRNLDEIPFPARELTEYRKYHSLIGGSAVATTIMASRGCPHRCSFCYIPYQGTLRLRSVGNIIREIEECVKLGIREFFFFDENFTADPRMAIGLCDAIIDRKLNITFYIRSRIDTVSGEMLKRLKKAGCNRIQFGVESGSQRILREMNKRTTLEQIEKAFALTRGEGIATYADFIVGYPGETLEEMRATIEFAKRLDPDFAQFGVTMLLPHTQIYKEALKTGFLKIDHWREFSRNPILDTTAPLASDLYDKPSLKDIQTRAYREFYFRGRYVFRRILSLHSLNQIPRYFKAGVNLLKVTGR